MSYLQHSAAPVPKGSNGAYAIVFSILLLSTSFVGYFWLTDFMHPSLARDYTAPTIPNDAFGTGTPPTANIAVSPGYNYELSWELGDVYPSRGGMLSVSLSNVGDNTIFVYSLGLSGEWLDQDMMMSKSIFVRPGETTWLGVIAFPGMNYVNPHRYYQYHLTVSLMVRDDALRQATGIVEWFDVGPVIHGDRAFTLSIETSLRPVFYLKQRNNLWSKVEGLITPGDPLVLEIVAELRSRYGEEYNAYHVAAAFHYVRNTIAYEMELPGEDWWQSPSETILLGKGDCEDHALLLASILKGLGGTANINIIAGHAFASVYLGANKEEAMKNWDVMQEYYGYMLDEEYAARPLPCWIDGAGYWLALDTLGGLYAGGLPVNSAPIRSDDGRWAFTSTMIVSIIPA